MMLCKPSDAGSHVCDNLQSKSRNNKRDNKDYIIEHHLCSSFTVLFENCQLEILSSYQNILLTGDFNYIHGPLNDSHQNCELDFMLVDLLKSKTSFRLLTDNEKCKFARFNYDMFTEFYRGLWCKHSPHLWNTAYIIP